MDPGIKFVFIISFVVKQGEVVGEVECVINGVFEPHGRMNVTGQDPHFLKVALARSNLTKTLCNDAPALQALTVTLSCAINISLQTGTMCPIKSL